MTIDEERLLRYAAAIGRDELDYLVGPNVPLPDGDHPQWKLWKRAAAAVIRLADREHPPPPGSTQRKLPDHILALIVCVPYTSTACGTARALQSAVIRHPEHAEELAMWRDLLHDYCRENHKFTNLPCNCGCHTDGVE